MGKERAEGIVLDQDYSRLERGDDHSLRKSQGNGTVGKKERGKAKKRIHVSVLEKIQKNNTLITKSGRGIAWRVWSKKARKIGMGETVPGRSLQMVNRGKVQRDRGLTAELLNLHE